MESFVDQCVRLIETHQAWAGVLVGLLAFGESLILIGILLPGTTVLVIVGGLVGAGLIHPLPVVVAAIIGAALGDIVSYYLGIWLGRGVVHKWPLNRHRNEIARARLFFRRYGFAAIFLGRFFGPVRATVPLVAGMMGMDRSRFQLANILSALVWAPAILMPGWLAAKGAGELIHFNATNILLLAAVAIVAAIVVALGGIKLLARSGRRSRGRA
ncbi:DedA family protein [Mesorhizobium sp. VK25A]|uniref:DedA family protein n=1 Tax=Mesorhizobium vachelliae TaxID=3072309 RepID=A0ABU4ZVU5_9HYPH|nr:MULTISPECIES: DedA family protein [unclassified Mesorhizobium]MDX8529534.1 DedA family protein [Mesorhizobium sp. VK25D]MDX8545744.1 DedA family protein [Mesorhizobium sp. VK25A]